MFWIKLVVFLHYLVLVCSQVCIWINGKTNEVKTTLLVAEHYSKRGEDSRELIWSPNEEFRSYFGCMEFQEHMWKCKVVHSAILGDSRQGKTIEFRLCGSNTKTCNHMHVFNLAVHSIPFLHQEHALPLLNATSAPPKHAATCMFTILPCISLHFQPSFAAAHVLPLN